MGFDVVYLPPIHPIGVTHRKGPDNTPDGGSDSVGSPWAIGNAAGGYTAVEPALGTLADFDHFVRVAGTIGIEVALDFAIQCSPDHPWVKEHPDWFKHRPDGSIKYAENPPKEYQDVYPIDFDTADQPNLMQALLDVLWFWVGHGVQDLPGRQSAHQAGRLLGMADRRGSVPASRRDFPGGGVHPAENDEGAGQGRLYSVIYLLHLAQHQV